MRSPLVLIPPAKGKHDGGDGPAYATTIADDHPLAAARRQVLTAATAAVDDLDDDAVVRIAGVRRVHVADGRARLRQLAELPTLPAHRRYAGIVHTNAALEQLDAGSASAEGRIVSALLGVVALGEPVPAYRLEFGVSLPGLGGVATFWRREARELLRDEVADRVVWDLLPGEHARVFTGGRPEGGDHRPVAFLRPDGRPANAARTKVAKGRVLGWLLRHATGATSAADVAGAVDPGEDWSLAVDGEGLRAVDHRGS